LSKEDVDALIDVALEQLREEAEFRILLNDLGGRIDPPENYDDYIVFIRR